MSVIKPIDKSVLAKAIGIMLMSWLALPIVYFLLLRRKKEHGEEKQGRENDESKGESSIC